MLRHRFAGMVAALAPVALACAGAAAQDFAAGDLTIRNPWARATPGGAQVAGGYLTVVNRGATSDRIVGGSMVAAATFELHDMSMDRGVMKMRPTASLEIPAGGSVTLDPFGKHIMFTGLKHGLKKGEAVEATLVFEHAGTVPIRFDVAAIGANGSAKENRSEKAGQSMPGMDMQ